MRIVATLVAAACLASAGHAFADELSVAGLVEPSAMVEMKAKSNGTIGRIKVKEGESVKKGQVLVELENSREKAMIALAKARIDSAHAALEERKVALANSQKDLERKLMMLGVIARKEFENAEDMVHQQEAAVLLRTGELQEAEAELQLRKAEFDDKQVKAPFSGVVTEIHVKEGEPVGALVEPICDIYAMDEMYVKVALPVGFIKFVDESTPVLVEVEKETHLSDTRMKGKISYINPTIEPTSRTFNARIQILDPHDLVRPGMKAKVVFLPPGSVVPGGESTNQ